MSDYFVYGNAEIQHLSQADARLAEVIHSMGFIKRKVMPDLFVALMHTIVGQQISTKAHATVWSRIEQICSITPVAIAGISAELLQSCGISMRKVGYMQTAANQVLSGRLNLPQLHSLPDEEVIHLLTQLPGIGQWSAEMLLMFSMQRPNILSYGDLGIQRGLCMLYGIDTIDRAMHKHFLELYSPYASVASIYVWAVSAGGVHSVQVAPS